MGPSEVQPGGTRVPSLRPPCREPAGRGRGGLRKWGRCGTSGADTLPHSPRPGAELGSASSPPCRHCPHGEIGTEPLPFLHTCVVCVTWSRTGTEWGHTLAPLSSWKYHGTRRADQLPAGRKLPGEAEGPLVIPEQARAVAHGSGPGSVSISGYPVPATNRVVGSKEAQLPVVGVEGLGPH